MAVGVLTAAPGLARVAPEPADSHPSTRTEQRTTTSDSACQITAADIPAPVALEGRRSNLRSSDSAAGYTGYPGGAAGTSNGELTAAQKGEPVGAGGTSGGSSSPFANAGTEASAIALTSVSGSVDKCPPAPSAATRRLIHADLMQALRDGQ
jgi:hypothetical protein